MTTTPPPPPADADADADDGAVLWSLWFAEGVRAAAAGDRPRAHEYLCAARSLAWSAAAAAAAAAWRDRRLWTAVELAAVCLARDRPAACLANVQAAVDALDAGATPGGYPARLAALLRSVDARLSLPPPPAAETRR